MKKIIIILVVCIVSQFIFTSKGAAYGEAVSNLDKQIDALKSENQKLEIEIASLTSYSKIASDSTEAVFLQANKKIEDLSIAYKR